MSEILPDGLRIIPYYITQTEDRLDKLWRVMMSENNVLERMIHDMKGQLNLDKSNFIKKQHEVNEYKEKIDQTEKILKLLESSRETDD